MHRVGRTARMGKGGEAYLFLLPSETGYVEKLEGLGTTLQEKSLAQLLDALPQSQQTLVIPALWLNTL